MHKTEGTPAEKLGCDIRYAGQTMQENRSGTAYRWMRNAKDIRVRHQLARIAAGQRRVAGYDVDVQHGRSETDRKGLPRA